MRRFIASTVMTVAIVSAANADSHLSVEQMEQAFDLGIEFTQCAGLNWALSELVPQLGQSDAENRWDKEIGNGAWTAAIYLFWTATNDFVKSRDLAEDHADMQRNSWSARLAGEHIDGAWSDALRQMERCMEITPIQAELVEEARKNMHLRGLFD